MAENKELLYTMELCGHFLFHRRGEKRGQVRVLQILCDNGKMSQKEVQGLMNIQSGSMSELIGKLEKGGFVERTRDSRDKRHYNLRITEKGMAEVQNLRKRNEEQEAVIFNALTESEQKELMTILKKLLSDWRDNYDESLFRHKYPGFIKGGENV